MQQAPMPVIGFLHSHPLKRRASAALLFTATWVAHYCGTETSGPAQQMKSHLLFIET